MKLFLFISGVGSIVEKSASCDKFRVERKFLHEGAACAANRDSVVFSVPFKETPNIFASGCKCHFL